MVGVKLAWTGVAIILALNQRVPHADIVGGIFMVLGVVLMWLDR